MSCLRLALALALLGTLVLIAPARAETKEQGELATVPEPPPLPADSAAPEDNYLEPEITISVKKDDTVQYEYRINGKLYMIKVVPAKGKPYYLIDPEGTGEWRRSFTSTVVPPQWLLKEF